MVDLNHVRSGYQPNLMPPSIFRLSVRFSPFSAIRLIKKTGIESNEVAYGLTSHSPESANAERIHNFNRKHWGVESHHYIIDWNWDEDRCRISKGHGPENITSLRRFATGLIKAVSKDSVASTIQRLARNVRQVLDYLRMTKNSRKAPI